MKIFNKLVGLSLLLYTSASIGQVQLDSSQIEDKAITNSKMADAVPWSFKARTSGTGAPTDMVAGDITVVAAPDTASYIFGFSDSGEFIKYTIANLPGASGVSDGNKGALTVAGDVWTINAGVIPDVLSDFTNDVGYLTDYTVTAADVVNVQGSLTLDASQITGLTFTIDTTLTETQVDAFVANNGYITTDTDTQLSEAEVDTFVANNGYITSITVADIEGLGFVTGLHTVDTDTQLSETEVDAFVANNGYITSYTVTEGDVTNHETALTIDESQITGLNYTVDTNTQLTEIQVDTFVANNGYITDVVGDTSPQLGGNLDTNNFTVSYDNATSGLTSSDIKSAIDELNTLYNYILTRDQVVSADIGVQDMNNPAVATLTATEVGTGWTDNGDDTFTISTDVDYVEFSVHVRQRIENTLNSQSPSPILELQESADGTTWITITSSATSFIADALNHEDSSNTLVWRILNPPNGQSYRLNKARDTTNTAVVNSLNGQFTATIRISQ